MWLPVYSFVTNGLIILKTSNVWQILSSLFMECILCIITKNYYYVQLLNKERKVRSRRMNSWRDQVESLGRSQLCCFQALPITFALHSYRVSSIIQLLTRNLDDDWVWPVLLWGQPWNQTRSGMLDVSKAWGRPLRMTNPQVRFLYHIEYLQDYTMSSVWVHTPSRFLPQWRSTCAFFPSQHLWHTLSPRAWIGVQYAEKANLSQGVINNAFQPLLKYLIPFQKNVVTLPWSQFQTMAY